MAKFLKDALSQGTNAMNQGAADILSQGTNAMNQGAADILSQGTNEMNQGAADIFSQGTNAMNQGAADILSQGTNQLSSKIPGLGNTLSAVKTISSVADALTPVTTKEDIINGVALILEEKITNILEEKITKVLEEKITEKIEVKVIQKLEEITKTVNDAIKTRANVDVPEAKVDDNDNTLVNAESNETNPKVGGRKSRKQKKNRITRKRRTNQKSFSQAFRRTRDRKQNSQ